MISKQKIWLIITIVLILLFTAIPNTSRLIPESKNYQTYTEALDYYNNNEFSLAYHKFGKVSAFSQIKPAAMYRQALCAEKTGDTKAEIIKYRQIIWRYPNSIIALKSKYIKAQRAYESKQYTKAKREFSSIVRNYPNNDYAIASQYYLGSVTVIQSKNIKNEKQKLKSQTKATQYFKTYLKNAPNGRFAISCIEKWIGLNQKLNNEDNLLIAKVYQTNEDYKNAQKYLGSTNIAVSWPYFVKNAYETKDFAKVRFYTVQGLQGVGLDQILINEDINDKTERENTYEAIDDYLKLSSDPKQSISYLLSIAAKNRKKAKGYDYLLYKSCNNMPVYNQTACFNTLYYEYPNGQFAADALANIFYDKVKLGKYFMAERIGKAHLAKYPDCNSSPMVMFWLAKVAERTKHYNDARTYYRNLIRKYPDDYYAYHAFLNLNRLRHFRVANLRQIPVKFPYETSNYGIITELAKVKDYGLINQFCKEDEFIQSWLAYLQGDYSKSARIARDAMAKIQYKPSRYDPKWRLVYPVHYYSDIKQSAISYHNDPVLILSIIREESYFNPKAKSPVGARGLMQLMPTTAKEAASSVGISLPNPNLLFDPYINLKLGNIYYSRLKKSLMQKDILAVLAYNGGIGSVSRWTEELNYVDADDFIEQIPYAETQNYLKKVYKSYWNYIRIYDGIR